LVGAVLFRLVNDRGCWGILLPAAHEHMTLCQLGMYLYIYPLSVCGQSRWILIGPHFGVFWLALAKGKALKESKQHWRHIVDPVKFLSA
jgi:hypothetical protein